MNRTELTKQLNSKPNKLAAQAIALLRTKAPLESLQAVVEAGSSDRHYYRDPLHPRSKYRVDHVIDVCFESKFGVVKEQQVSTPSGTTFDNFSLGHIPATGGLTCHFEYLLEKGFSPGRNNYRGDLFPSIVKTCFYRDPAESAMAMEFSKILVARGEVDIQAFAENNYEWTSSEKKLQRVIELGAIPSSKMLDCALRYCSCAQNPGDPDTGRAEVIRTLMCSGLGLTPSSGDLRLSKDQQIFLKKNGIADLSPPPTPSLSAPFRLTPPPRPVSKSIPSQ